MTLRAAFLLVALQLVFAFPAKAEPSELDWSDLVPPEARGARETTFRGLVEHSQVVSTNPFLKALDKRDNRPVNKGLPRPELDGQTVRLSGYVVPSGMRDGDRRSVFLVPYFGACLHVPAPPANQIVLVTSENGFDPQTLLASLLDPVIVTGTLSVLDVKTGVASAAYSMAAQSFETTGLLASQ